MVKNCCENWVSATHERIIESLLLTSSAQKKTKYLFYIVYIIMQFSYFFQNCSDVEFRESELVRSGDVWKLKSLKVGKKKTTWTFIFSTVYVLQSVHTCQHTITRACVCVFVCRRACMCTGLHLSLYPFARVGVSASTYVCSYLHAFFSCLFFLRTSARAQPSL